ncbi:hypothetical protein DFJ69_6159 [Thermomonospora umbrina]|uniref:Uncharacterized protein n=1 Tax=Thermomonospora umbrina TaxID=111806 RepID=A0A3D9T2L8_9ACTN|nr:hypothetical protein DFJ69_6159 [Thermomonospora umbrina]
MTADGKHRPKPPKDNPTPKGPPTQDEQGPRPRPTTSTQR